MRGRSIRQHRPTLAAIALAAGLGLVPAAQAADPLDDLDGTEGWDQVVKPAPERKPEPKADQDDIQAEITQWESIRVTWEQEREKYMRERAAQKTMAARMQPAARARSTMEINDSNVDQVTGDDWGDAPGEQWLVPAGAVDKAIDDELSESKPASPPARSAPPALPVAPPPAALTPPPEASSVGDVPSAFTQPKRNDLGGGLAPTAPDPDAPLPPTSSQRPEPTAKSSADDGAKAAAEMIRKQQEDKRRKEAEDKARREAEADAGAAAAAELLKQQAERERKEQEALRKKAGVEVDGEGQVIDPDLKREMDGDD